MSAAPSYPPNVHPLDNLVNSAAATSCSRRPPEICSFANSQDDATSLASADLAAVLFAYNLRSPFNPPEGENGSKRLGSLSKKATDILPLLALQSPDRVRRCRYVGLRNLGATCYMNSYLQSLFMNLDFRFRLFELASQNDDEAAQAITDGANHKHAVGGGRTDIVAEVQSLFTVLQSGLLHVADPSGVARALRIATDYQEDTTEFATLLLMALEKQLGGATSPKNFIPKLFRGFQTQWMICEVCQKVSKRTDDFYELRVRVPHVQRDVEASASSSSVSTRSRKKSATSPARSADEAETRLSESDVGNGVDGVAGSQNAFHLEDGLAQLFRTEYLREENKYVCDTCADKVEAQRRIFISGLPPYLHVCFERYAYDDGGRKKLTTLVEYPLTLSLAPFLEPDSAKTTDEDASTYELIGVLEHHGSSALSGHYIAYLKDLTPADPVPQHSSDGTQTSVGKSRKRSVKKLNKLPPMKLGNLTLTRAAKLLETKPGPLGSSSSVASTNQAVKEEVGQTDLVVSLDTRLGRKTGIKKNPTKKEPSEIVPVSKKRRKNLVTPAEAPSSSPSLPPQSSQIPLQENDQDTSCDTEPSTTTSVSADACAPKVPPSGDLQEEAASQSRKKSRYHAHHPKVVETPGAHRSITHKGRGNIPATAGCYYGGLRYDIGEMSSAVPPQTAVAPPPSSADYDPSRYYVFGGSLGLYPPPPFPVTSFDIHSASRPGTPTTAGTTAGVPVGPPPSLGLFPYPPTSYPLVSRPFVAQSFSSKSNVNDPFRPPLLKHLVLSPIALSTAFYPPGYHATGHDATSLPTVPYWDTSLDSSHNNAINDTGRGAAAPKVSGPQASLAENGLLVRPAGAYVDGGWKGSGTGLQGGADTIATTDMPDILVEVSPSSRTQPLSDDEASEPLSDDVAAAGEEGGDDQQNLLQLDSKTSEIVIAASPETPSGDGLCHQQPLPPKEPFRRKFVRRPKVPDQVTPSFSDQHWSWIQFDDASVNEWKIQEVLLPPLAASQVSETDVRYSTSPRLCSRSAYLAIYKKCSWKPTSAAPPPKAMEEALCAATSRAAAEQPYHPVVAERFQTFMSERREAVSGLIKQTARLLQERAHRYKSKVYTVMNERPLYTDILSSFVFVPMSWWGAFLCGLDYASIASVLPPELRPERVPTSPNTVAISSILSMRQSDEEDTMPASAEESRPQLIFYDDILCPHYLECIASGTAPVGTWKGLLDEDEESRFATAEPDNDGDIAVDHENRQPGLSQEKSHESSNNSTTGPSCVSYGNSYGVDPLAVWEGRSKLVPSVLISDIFTSYKLAASIPKIGLHDLTCRYCSTALTQLVEYMFEQRGVFLEMLRFSRSYDPPSLAKKSQEDPSATTHHGFALHVSGEENNPPLTWVARRALADTEFRFGTRDKTKKFVDRHYDVHAAGEDARKLIHKLREAATQARGSVEAAAVKTEDHGDKWLFSATLATDEFSEVKQQETALPKRIDFADGVLCIHGKLSPERKPGSRALVPKEKLERFLELEALKTRVLTSQLVLPQELVALAAVTCSGFVYVDTWTVGASKKSIVIDDTVCGSSVCLTCEKALAEERARAQDWRTRMEEERALVGDCVFRRACKIVKPQDARRYAPYCLAEGRHYLVPNSWITAYLSYVAAKDAESAKAPGCIRGDELLEHCKCTPGQPQLAVDPISYLVGQERIVLHPKENMKHPEVDLYVLVHESEFDVLDRLYGSSNVPYVAVTFAPGMTSATPVSSASSSSASSSSPSQQRVMVPEYEYSVPVCGRCVEELRFAPGGIADFGPLTLRLKLEAPKLSTGRQTSRRRTINVSAETSVQDIIDQTCALLGLLPSDIAGRTIQLTLEGPAIHPFFRPETVTVASQSTQLSCVGTDTPHLIPWCQLPLIPGATATLRDFHTMMDDRWVLHIRDER